MISFFPWSQAHRISVHRMNYGGGGSFTVEPGRFRPDLGALACDFKRVVLGRGC